MSQPKILFVLTSHDKMGSLDKPTGWYLPEFAHPYHVLAPHASITIASPNGGASPLDPSSIDKSDKISAEFLSTKEALWKKTEKLGDFVGKSSEFDALFYVGGHGPMFDLAHSATSHKLINEFYAAGKVVAAVCHGPAALAYVKTEDGKWLLDGHEATGFSNSEEDAVQLSSVMPFMLEDQLKVATGGNGYKKAEQDWGAFVLTSRNVITGQNPASATGVGEAILKAVKA